MDLFIILSGAFSGFFVGLTGVGGGAITTPILILVFGVTPFVAVGTDMWFAASTKLVASSTHYGRGLIDLSIVKSMWIGSIPASLIALGVIVYLPIEEHVIVFLKLVVAFAVLLTAIGMLFQKKLHHLGEYFRTYNTKNFKSLQIPLTVCAGFILGLMVTITSIGAGAFGVVLLSYLYPFRLTTSKLIATDIAHAIPLAVFAGVGHWWIGNIDFSLLGNLLLGSIPAVLIGSQLSLKLSHVMLRYCLSLLLLLIGGKMVFSILFGY